jgi:hypothetical protein
MKFPASGLFLVASLFLGAGCRDSSPPAPVSAPIKLPLTAQQKEDSLKAALINYNGARPLEGTGKPFPVFNTRIIGGEQDTILFNGERWSHRAELRREVRFMGHPDAPEGTTERAILNVTYSYSNPQNRDDGEMFTLMVPNAVGRYRNAELIQYYLGTAYFLVKSDVVVDSYTLNPALDNWIEVTATDQANKRAKGRYTLHFYIKPPSIKKSLIYSPIVLPNTIHLTGSFN